MPSEELSKAARNFLKWGNKQRSTKNKVSESSGSVMQGLRFSNTLEIINTWHQLYRDCLLVAMKWRYVMKHGDVYYSIHLMPTYIMRSKFIYLQGSEQFEDAHHHNCLWCKAGQLCEWSRSERKISRLTCPLRSFQRPLGTSWNEETSKEAHKKVSESSGGSVMQGVQ